MKNLITITVFAAWLTLSMNTYAASLTYNGYTLNTDTNIVTGGGLQWLQWDVTVGMSISDALNAYSSDGWTLAANEQMEGLLDAFFEPARFGSDENVSYSQKLSSPVNSTDDIANQFINLFGDTYKAGGFSFGDSDKFELAAAFFGGDDDSDTLFNHVAVSDEFNIYNASFSGRVEVASDYLTAEHTQHNIGVALVRDIQQLSAVPVPAAAFMFAPALLGFLGLHRQRRA